MDVLSKQVLLCGQRTRKLDFYKHCVFGKKCRVSFNVVVHRIKGILDYIHSAFEVPFKFHLKVKLVFI